MGKRFSFRLRDYADYTISNQIIAVGDGKTSSFQMFKMYHDDINSYRRKITK